MGNFGLLLWNIGLALFAAFALTFPLEGRFRLTLKILGWVAVVLLALLDGLAIGLAFHGMTGADITFG